MVDPSNIQYVQATLTAYAHSYPRMGVASIDGSGGVPPAMFDGEVQGDGWVSWKMLPSTLEPIEVERLEKELNIEFPPLFRAYLLAGFQLFDQIHSSRHDQLIFNVEVPSNNPLGPIRNLIEAWRPLVSADYLPFAQWGDSWGPFVLTLSAAVPMGIARLYGWITNC